MAKKKIETETVESEQEEVKETKLSLEERIKNITSKIDTIKKGIGDDCGCGRGYDPFGLVRASSDWIEIVEDSEFTEEYFLKYQNYLKLEPELLKVFLSSHTVTQNFIELFYGVKLWKLDPNFVIHLQPHLEKFIRSKKEEMDKSVFEAWENKMNEVSENLKKIKKNL